MQPFVLILLLVAVIAGGTLGYLARNRERLGGPVPPARSSEHDTKLQHPENIRRLLVEKKKIQAIKLYRDETKVSLREAKDAVERMEAAMRWATYEMRLAKIDTHLSSQDIPIESKEEIKRRLLLGMKLNAIIAYRDATGVGLKEAKAAVDHMEAGADETET